MRMNDMETKFTKGEWRVEHFVNEKGFEIAYNDDGEVIADYVYEEPDAHLIARAPNLYHALKRTNEELALLIDLYNKKVKDPAHFIDAETCHLNNIELAKARGE